MKLYLIVGLILLVLISACVQTDKYASDALYCESDNDCTKYNTNGCCDWKPINKYNFPQQEHYPQICDAYCPTIPKCENKVCVLEYTNEIF